MRSARTLGAAVGASLVLLVSSLAAGAAPTSGASTSTSSRHEVRAHDSTQTGGEEFVVAYDAAHQDQAMASIAAAGGAVLDVTQSAGLALVGSSEAGFLDEVRAAPAISGAASNHSVGTSRPGMPHRFAEERPNRSPRATAGTGGAAGSAGRGARATEPLADLQWDMAMIGATPDGAWRRATGRGVTVGVIDTGVDASHPDIAPNFSQALSRNFTMDIPAVDGPCEVATCIDPANVDDGGHGTHVAGIMAAARNGLGIAGVAPEATIVNVRAGQDSGYFFLYETVAALTYAGDAALDVVNMSFFTDPWLYNCESAADYVAGTPTEEEIAEQAFIRSTVLAALDYATAHGVTLVAAAGNEHTDLDEPLRFDAISPDYPPGNEQERTVTDNCLDVPSEGPDVVSVSAVGPSTTKADYSNYGFGQVEVSAPGGWFRDGVGTPTFSTPGNLVLSSYPLDLAIEEGKANPDGTPTDEFSVRSCNSQGTSCGFYTYLQGTSMASPHAAGVAALIVEEHGSGNRARGFSLAPATVRSILLGTATDHACPAGGVEIYTDEGRPPEFNAVCEGSTANNGLYGEGIVSATAAVRR
jgi:subtilisin family serine protease